MTTLTLSNIELDTPSAGYVRVTFAYADATPGAPQQQSTIGYFPTGHPTWSRAVRLTGDALQILRNGADGVAIDVGALNAVAYTMENSLTFAPHILASGQPSDISVVAGSTDDDFEVTAGTELAADYLWEYESKAEGTLTSTGTAPADGDTVVIDGTTYTFKTALSTSPDVPYEVLIGASAAAALDNLKAAINGDAGEGTTYATGTVAHTTVEATTNTDTTQLVRARTSGTAGNAYATTETSAQLSWGGTVMSGGGSWANATGTAYGCVYTGGTTATLNCDPTTTEHNGTYHRCTVTNGVDATVSDTALLTITAT